LVSICIPVYNGSAHLEEALASIFSQDYLNLEILAFDDASSDGSWELLQSIRNPRFQSSRNSRNLGPGGNWNQALAAARGTYVKLFHQDDRLVPGAITSQVEALEAHPEAVMAFCRREIIRPDGKKLCSRGGGWPTGLVTSAEAAHRCALKGANLLGEPSAVLLRREVAQRVGDFDISIPYLVDLDYWLRMMAHGPAWYEDQSLASFRVSPRQWSATIGMRQGREFAAFLDRLKESHLQGKRLVSVVGKSRAHLNGLLRSLIYRFL
jgi:glycosyltransferase involved in cell wall biosynthesis